MNIGSLILIALLIEAIINIFKPVWDKTAKKMTVTEYVSMAVGVVIAVIMKLNLLFGMVETDSVFVLYIFYVLTGIALGRGPSFVYDLWLKLKSNYGNGLPAGDSTSDKKTGDG